MQKGLQSTNANHEPPHPVSPPGLASQWLLEKGREKYVEKENREDTTHDRSEAAEIVDFMREAWKLPTPNLIISMTGGADFLQNLSPHIYKLFQKDLVSAAVATNAWIFTGGSYSGVMKEIGNALNIWRYQGTKTALSIPCIGIINWYATTGSIIKNVIPIVQILINGGPSTIITFCEAISQKTPVLVIHVREYIGLLVSINHVVLDVF
ncbi:unnamed protein product [Rotaria sp. Silwood2]|nr:unnamed protein product [Rotaria sp. Silwood2]CAF4183680.1 unnamed protein product [Rotaria sp. Silwood2]CAF4218642.1 unnamed protein product [Rotaria sp. Silwood2]CAF4324881.1 unnamed protein product [Rotaria sp. Silwood2]